MTVVLTVDSADWRRHVDGIASAVAGLVPVVKGNGYGFGRAPLAAIAAELGDTLAVGTVHELAGMPTGVTTVVLTPTLRAPDTLAPILTVGSPEHVDALRDWGGRVLVKLGSTMRRFGRGPELIETARAAGLDVVGVSIHPPLAGSDADHRAEVEAWLPRIDPIHEVWLSHLSPAEYTRLPASHRYRLRVGTLLWHGDKSTLHLGADVL
ncbi:MAG TPA: alanine racemase, partial [Ilumatobacteraceae bacterium]